MHDCAASVNKPIIASQALVSQKKDKVQVALEQNVHSFSQERKRQIFEKVANYAQVRNKDYKFEEVPGSHGTVIKYLYFGDDLVGIGQDLSARTAKLRCAIDALANLKQGKLAERKVPKDGKLPILSFTHYSEHDC